SRTRQLAHRRPDVRTRRDARDDLLHLALRLPRRARDQIVEAFLGQMIAEQAERREMNLPALDSRKEPRKPLHELRGNRAPKGSPFAHAKTPPAEVEDR